MSPIFDRCEQFLPIVTIVVEDKRREAVRTHGHPLVVCKGHIITPRRQTRGIVGRWEMRRRVHEEDAELPELAYGEIRTSPVPNLHAKWKSFPSSQFVPTLEVAHAASASILFVSR